MNTLTVWRFGDPGGAERACAELAGLAQDHVVQVDDAALLTWPADRRSPGLRDLGTFAAPGALWRGFWIMVLGLVFVAPHAGLTLGAAAGAVTGGLADFGIDDGFVVDLRERVGPGSSALFILSDAGQVEALRTAVGDSATDLLRADLDDEEQARLRAALAADRGP